MIQSWYTDYAGTMLVVATIPVYLIYYVYSVEITYDKKGVNYIYIYIV